MLLLLPGRLSHRAPTHEKVHWPWPLAYLVSELPTSLPRPPCPLSSHIPN